jgi:ferric-dicitrate binding protein FerR (iron transport regulator)
MEPFEPSILISRVLEGEASLAEVAALRDACVADPELGRRFAREVTLHRLTGPLLARGDSEARFAAEVVARIQGAAADDAECAVTPLRVEKRVRRWIFVKRWGGAFALAAAVALIATLGILMMPRQGAVLTRAESVAWEGGTGPVVGDHLKSGRIIEISAGLVSLDFKDGVSVLLEGPARLEITGGRSARLDFGRLVARVIDERGKGFIIDAPSGRVVDLGTEFGVSVERSGEMEVHVLEGAVTASSKGSRETPVTLHKDEAMRLSAGPVERIPADDGAFVTNLPPLPGASPGFIRWSFEEPDGIELHNSGNGLAEADAGARLLSAGGSGRLAKRIEGRIGRGLAFDGAGSYVESGFAGISGQAPRTVSLWARIPVDHQVTQSYAMIGWGKVEGLGSAWQISVNPDASEGPIGALRAGTGRGAVVGSTDLRDGRWHHLTVVMYGGSPTTATHVLLYVDGVLESTTRKSVRAIFTEPSTYPHGVWLGRNLSAWSPDPPGAKFFRGELDEVHIFSAALDEAMIRQVMDGSSP